VEEAVRVRHALVRYQAIKDVGDKADDDERNEEGKQMDRKSNDAGDDVQQDHNYDSGCTNF
jgi:hypothetical protein